MTPILAAALILCADPVPLDGDTLICDGFRLRLWGIQAPERHEYGGPTATRALGDLVMDQTLVCKRKGKSFDRIVAQCWIGNRDVAGEMVRAGHARDWPKFSHGAYAKDQPR